MKIKVFFTGFLQVFFISVNTYFISHSMYIGVGICAFAIAIVWSFNVSSVSYDRKAMMFYYATGSAIGSLLGLYISEAIVAIIEMAQSVSVFGISL